MLLHAEKAIAFLADAPEELVPDEKTLFAGLRTRHPEIPWRGVAGTRDSLVHGCFGIEGNVVRRTRVEDLPPLLVRLRRLLEEPNRETRSGERR